MCYVCGFQGWRCVLTLRNDLIEEQILQIETDRALHSVGR